MSLRDKILDADDLESRTVNVPQWGCDVVVKSPTARTRAQLLRRYADEDGNLDLEALYPALVIATACDPETGELLFTPDDTDALATKNGAAIDIVATAAVEVAGLSAKASDDVGKGS